VTFTTTKSARKRFVFVIGVLGLSALTWIAFSRVRGLLMLGYVDSAIGRVRALVAAEEQFAKIHTDVGYTCTLSRLRHDEQTMRLANDGRDNGYAFDIVGCQAPEPKKPNSMYYVSARPLHSGLPAFCSDQSGIVKFDDSGSVEKCLANGSPL
jgi:hypothetical protein